MTLIFKGLVGFVILAVLILVGAAAMGSVLGSMAWAFCLTSGLCR